MAAMHLWEMCTEVRVDIWGGRAIQSTILCDATIGGGAPRGDGGGRRGGGMMVVLVVWWSSYCESYKL